MLDPTALAAAIGAPTVPRTLRAEPAIVAFDTLMIGPSAVPETIPSGSPLVEGQGIAAEGSGVEGSTALVAQGLGMAVASFVGAAVGVATSAVPPAAMPSLLEVFRERYIAGGGVLLVPVSVEAPPVACVDMAPCEANDCTCAVGEGVSVAAGAAVDTGVAVGVAVAGAGVAVGLTVAVWVGTVAGVAVGRGTAVAVGAMVAVGCVVAVEVGAGGGEGDGRGVGCGATVGGMTRVGVGSTAVGGGVGGKVGVGAGVRVGEGAVVGVGDGERVAVGDLVGEGIGVGVRMAWVAASRELGLANAQINNTPPRRPTMLSEESRRRVRGY